MRVVSNLLITLGGDSVLITRSVITRVTVADSLRGGGRVGLGVTDCYLKNGQGHSLVWDASPGANDKISSNSSLNKDTYKDADPKFKIRVPSHFSGGEFCSRDRAGGKGSLGYLCRGVEPVFTPFL